MKIITNLIKLFLSILALPILFSCAAGAATAGYSIKAQSADSLTASAEQRLVDRVKSEIMLEHLRDNQGKGDL